MFWLFAVAVMFYDLVFRSLRYDIYVRFAVILVFDEIMGKMFN